MGRFVREYIAVILFSISIVRGYGTALQNSENAPLPTEVADTRQSDASQEVVSKETEIQTEENGLLEIWNNGDSITLSDDVEHKLILGQWRNSAASHSWAEYKCRNNEYMMERELCEEQEWDSDEEIWEWKVNGEEIGRSSELSMSEIDDLIYNENSEWGIAGDRWRTIYNNGSIIDYSIYDEPDNE